jgi:tRNA-specific 2-thiouridylase
LRLSDQLGASKVATGHYARIVERGARLELHRARDASKDQSYFLHALGEAALSRLLFPLGELDKATVRAEAQRLALPGANKGESQELCFVPTGHYAEFVEKEAPERLRPGPIVDDAGRPLGRHHGIHSFTVGQRKNLGVAIGRRAYVVGIDAEAATVRLGAADALRSNRALLENTVFGSDVALPLRCEVSVRYRGQPRPARVMQSNGSGLVVEFDEPATAVVPGQYAVFYAGDRVLGGGAIKSSWAAQSAEAS